MLETWTRLLRLPMMAGWLALVLDPAIAPRGCSLSRAVFKRVTMGVEGSNIPIGTLPIQIVRLQHFLIAEQSRGEVIQRLKGFARLI